MNILFISHLYPSKENDFVTTVLHNIVKHLNKNKNVIVIRPVYIYLSEIFTGKCKKNLRPKKIILDNVLIIIFPIFKIPKIAYFYNPLYRYLNKYFKNNTFKPDIVVAHYDKSLQIGYKYSKKNNLPLVAGLHITLDLLEESYLNFNNRCSEVLEYSSLIASRSNYIYKKINKWYQAYEKKNFIAYSGIQNELIESSDDIINRMKEWKSTGKVSFISVSSLIERKKIHTNLSALGQIKDKLNWTYTIIGDGDERYRLEQLVHKLNISNQVIFKGKLKRDAVINELNKSHIFIMVSNQETFGLAYLEAMASGNIVIGSIDEGIDGIIKDGENGFLLPAGKVEPLAKLLKKIVFNMKTNELEEILTNSHKTISYYTEKQASDNYWKQLKKITGK